jgi:eukaryotic-like serine/threonine-protein kinase
MSPLTRHMDAAALATLSRLLDEALAREPGARTAWLESLGPEYDTVKPRLLRLLTELPALGTSGFLGTLPQLETFSEDEEPFPTDRDPLVGAAIGPYRLVRALAEGGMGSVWLAERTDGMVNRPVALKLPRGTWHRRGLAERMAREREILAALNHPNIARLYDAGLADGQPYLALEYVEGRRIDEHCRVTGLDVRARIHLVLQVARAVAHAHAKLVVHRDLKPSNILVTEDGQVRLLDFGIATLLEGGRAKDSTLTEMSGRALTPEYASPEQVAGTPLGVASDVYSLGVVLYELLTGARPYQITHDSAAALEAAILDADVRRPSEAADTPRARRALQGDLDTIVLKCLKKRPDDRYGTMNALADDLERHLNGRPVLAQPDSRWYRARKFIGRNRLVVAATAATVVAILAGATGALVGLVRATRAEAAARQQSTTAQHVSAFLTGLFGASDPNARATTTLRDLLDRGATRIEPELKGQPKVQASLFETLSHVYGSLGLHRDAVALAEKSLALDDAAGDVETLQTAEASMTLGRSAWALGDFERARQAFERALATRTRLVGENDLGVAAALNQLGGLHGQQERFDEAIAAHTRALAIQRRVRGPEDVAVTNSLRGLGIVHSRRKDYATALGMQQQVLAIYRKTYGDDHAITADGFEGVAIYLRELKRFAEAHLPAERSLEIRKKVLPPNHPATAFSYDTLGELLMAEGRLDAALQPFQESLRIREAALGANNPRTGDSLASLGLLRLRRGDLAESRLLLERATAIYDKAYGASHSKTIDARKNLSLAHARRGTQPAPDDLPLPR